MTSRRCQILKEFWPDFNATENDFKNPTQNFVMRFYEKFFDECALSELLMEPIPTGKVLYPALIKESLPVISTCVFLRKIFSEIKGSQFGLEDIIDPNPKRASKQIEMLTNFLAYVDCHAGPYSNQALADSDEKVLEKERFVKEIDEIKEEFNKCAMRKAKYASELKMTEDLKLNHMTVLDNMRSKQDLQDAEYEVSSATAAEKKAELQTLDTLAHKEMEEIKALKEKIVLSPDAISRQQAELIIRKRELESDHIHLMSLAKEKNRFGAQLEQLITMINSRLPQVQDLGAKLTFSRELEKGLEMDEEALKNAKEKVDAATEKANATKQQFAHLNREVEEFKTNCNTMRSSMEKSFQQILKDKLEAEEKQIEQGARQVLIAQEKEQWNEKIKSFEVEKADFIKYFNAKEEEVNNAVKYFQELLNAQTGAIMQNLAE